MAEEVTNSSEVKSTSDGTVNITVEKYEELLKKAARPTTVNTTRVVKTAEMAAKDLRIWGGTFMGLGATLFTIGAFLYRAGRVAV